MVIARVIVIVVVMVVIGTVIGSRDDNNSIGLQGELFIQA